MVQGTFRTELRNSDIFYAQVMDDYEYLPRPFRIFGTVTIPVAGYRFQNFHTQYDFGVQHKVAESVAYDHGGFYGGTKKTVTYALGRASLSSHLAFEPAVSLVQFNSTTHALSNNVRLRWEYQPGSELFVVYNDGRNTLVDGFPDLANRSFVVKITRLFRR